MSSRPWDRRQRCAFRRAVGRSSTAPSPIPLLMSRSSTAPSRRPPRRLPGSRPGWRWSVTRRRRSSPGRGTAERSKSASRRPPDPLPGDSEYELSRGPLQKDEKGQGDRGDALSAYLCALPDGLEEPAGGLDQVGADGRPELYVPLVRGGKGRETPA